MGKANGPMGSTVGHRYPNKPCWSSHIPRSNLPQHVIDQDRISGLNLYNFGHGFKVTANIEQR